MQSQLFLGAHPLTLRWSTTPNGGYNTIDEENAMVVGNLRAVNNTKVVDNRVVGVAIMVDNTDVVQR